MRRMAHPLRRCLSLGLAVTVVSLSGLADARATLAQAQGAATTRNTAFFRQAQKELPGAYYFLYRVVDRLARANDLDKGPWRVVRMPEYDINAYATQVNLIAVYTGLLDVLAGDSDAISVASSVPPRWKIRTSLSRASATNSRLIARVCTISCAPASIPRAVCG